MPSFFDEAMAITYRVWSLHTWCSFVCFALSIQGIVGVLSLSHLVREKVDKMINTPTNSILTLNKSERYANLAKKVVARYDRAVENTRDKFSTLGGIKPEATETQKLKLAEKVWRFIERSDRLAIRSKREQIAEKQFRLER
jgi:allophanate hydrolase subunit 2